MAVQHGLNTNILGEVGVGLITPHDSSLKVGLILISGKLNSELSTDPYNPEVVLIIGGFIPDSIFFSS